MLCEGVETPDQRDFLGNLGVDEFQGWLYARALPAQDCERLLAQGALTQAAPADASAAPPVLST